VFVNYNGHLIAPEEGPRLTIPSRFRFHTGLFETMLVVNGAIQLLRLHYRRLEKGLKKISYPLPEWLNQDFLETEILNTIEQNTQAPYYRVRLQVAREENRLSFVIEAVPIQEDVFSLNEKGWKVQTVSLDEKKMDATANLKLINPSFYDRSARLAGENNCDDVLIKHSNKIIESGIGNVFWVRDKTIYTPPLSDSCVEGVMRTFLLQQLSPAFKMQERSLSLNDLYSADEVFITNAIRRIKWVGEVDGHSFQYELIRQIVAAVF
jgi:branched-chain amino acid aminotransferase